MLVAIVLLAIAVVALSAQMVLLRREVRARCFAERQLGEDLLVQASAQRLGPIVAELLRYHAGLQQELRLIAQSEQARAERYRRHAEGLTAEMRLSQDLVAGLRALLAAQEAERRSTEPGLAPVPSPAPAAAPSRPDPAPNAGRAPLASSVLPRAGVEGDDEDTLDEPTTVGDRRMLRSATILPPAEAAQRGVG